MQDTLRQSGKLTVLVTGPLNSETFPLNTESSPSPRHMPLSCEIHNVQTVLSHSHLALVLSLSSPARPRGKLVRGGRIGVSGGKKNPCDQPAVTRRRASVERRRGGAEAERRRRASGAGVVYPIPRRGEEKQITSVPGLMKGWGRGEGGGGIPGIPPRGR